MVQRIVLAVSGLLSVGLVVVLLVVTRTKDARIRELDGRVVDLSENNRRAGADLEAGARARRDLETKTVSRAAHADLEARYEAAVAERKITLENQGRQSAEIERELGQQREQVAVLRSRLSRLEAELSQKNRVLAGMEDDRLDIIQQVVELEDFLGERERQMANLETRFEKQDSVLEELKAKDAEQSARLQKILDRLQNGN